MFIDLFKLIEHRSSAVWDVLRICQRIPDHISIPEGKKHARTALFCTLIG